MKRIAVIILGLIVGLIAFLTVRTIVYPWRRPIEAGTAARIQIDADAVARKLSEAVRFRTISQDEPSANDPGQLVAFREWLERTYPTVHSKLRREVVGDYSILYTWPGTDAALAPVMLLAHMDVVPVQPESENLWVHPPFAGAISDGYVWGRGTLDMKTTLVGVMEAAERELSSGKQPRRTIMIGLGHDEEAGGANGAAAIARLLKGRGVRLEWVLDEGSVIADGIVAGLGKPLALIGVAEKGYLTAQIVVTAPGGHSAIPPYETAVTKLARVITRIQENPLPAKVDGAASGLLASLGPYLPIVQRTAIANQWLVWLVSQSRSLEVYGDECSVTNNICADHAFRQSERKRAAQRSSRHRKRANTSTRHSGQCCGALTRAFPERSGHSNQTCAGIRRKSNCSLIDRIHGISSD